MIKRFINTEENSEYYKNSFFLKKSHSNSIHYSKKIISSGVYRIFNPNPAVRNSKHNQKSELICRPANWEINNLILKIAAK
ncbi:MAG: hypothetical protein GX640_19775 [Fibrobacter sp.]|nr:hypothetical protein [Fibrobacter sp.]